MMTRGAWALVSVALLGFGLGACAASAQQVPDTTFDVRVAQPAFPAGQGPRVLLDEAHHNFHTARGRYKPFADLARSDGFRVVGNVAAFSMASLVGQNVLVISNAMGAADMGDSAASQSAFTDDEVAAVADWVRRGGALLLIADHAPFGAAASRLGEALGVRMRNAYTLDPGQTKRKGGLAGLIPFTAGTGLDTSHAIIRGSAASERVRTVTTFTGQSLEGPAGAVSLLTLPATAEDVLVTPAQMARGAKMDEAPRLPAGGRSQGLAFVHGKGRVVVLGEAAMLSAQLAGPGGRFKMGMNAEGNDNRQFALNVMRWLAGVLR